ncbi:unnamed protein product [Protopolystoma xenopodis]|uniref:Uncharacterized protein n=1 Tax=Protopolystoma xenopodis TaxID=117903 RepID=A0A448WH73_9PLAT|nr:unnamed protein product [Protopolystoma xenopodis]
MQISKGGGGERFVSIPLDYGLAILHSCMKPTPPFTLIVHRSTLSAVTVDLMFHLYGHLSLAGHREYGEKGRVGSMSKNAFSSCHPALVAFASLEDVKGLSFTCQLQVPVSSLFSSVDITFSSNCGYRAEPLSF